MSGGDAGGHDGGIMSVLITQILNSIDRGDPRISEELLANDTASGLSRASEDLAACVAKLSGVPVLADITAFVGSRTS